MGRLIKLAAAVLLAGVITLAAGAYWLLHTEPGANWLFARVQAPLGEQLSVGEIKGDLRSGLTLRDVRYRSENLEVHAALTQLSARAGLWPPRLRLPNLRVRDVRVHSTADAQATGGPPDLAAWQLPVPVTIDDAELVNVSWLDGGTSEPLVVDELRFALAWGRSLELRALQLTAPGLSAGASGELALHSGGEHQLELAIDHWQALGLEGLELTAAGNLAQTRVQASAVTPPLTIGGPVDEPLGDMRAVLDWTLSAWPGLGPGWLLREATGRLSGAAADYQLRAEGLVDTPAGPGVQVQLEAHGSLEALQFEQLLLSGPGLQARATGRVDWSGGVQAGGQVDIGALDLSAWALPGMEQWPAGLALNGMARLEAGPEQIRVADLDLRLGDTDARVTGAADFTVATENLDARLQWQNLAWPPTGPAAGEPARLSSARGELALEGTLSAWRLSGQAGLAAAGYPAGDVQLSASGSRQQADIEHLDMAALGGSVVGSGAVHWREALQFDADLYIEGVDLATLDQRWPETLSGSMQLAYVDQPPKLELELQPLEGRWRGQAFAAQGGLQWSPGALGFDAVEVRSESLRLSVDGRPLAVDGVRFDLRADGAPWLGGMGAGQLTARGRAGLEDGLLDVDLELDGQGITIGALALGQVTAAGRLAEGLNVEAQQLSWPGAELERLELQAVSTPQATRLHWQLQDAERFLRGRVQGEAIGPAQLQGESWQGQLAALALGIDARPLLELERPAALVVDGGGMELSDACLLAGEDGRGCIERLHWSVSGLDISGSLQDWPLGLTQEWLASGLRLSQELSGPFSFSRQGAAPPSGRVALSLSPGRFTHLEHGEVLESSEGFIGFVLEQGRLRDGRVELRFPEVGSADLDLDIDGVALDGNGQLDGRLLVDVQDLAPLQLLFPAVESMRGRLLVDLDLSGRSADPQMAGKLRVSDGGFLLPLLGLRAWGLELDGRVTRRDRIEAQGSARVGDGLAEISLSAEFSDWSNPALQVRLSGTDLQALDLPDLSALVDPDIQFGWQDGVATVGGNMLLHDTRIAPITSFVVPQEESPDLVIVNAGQQQVAPTRNGSAVSVFGGLELRLGDRVRFESALANATLGGAISLDWNGPAMPLAEGAVRVTGEVSAYGPRLVMEDSYLRFNGGPAANPNLDISAERDIFGNTQLRAAGVRITGPAERPEVEAYTVPYTNQDRAWALLITGSDLDYGQGIGAFDIGTYIAPRLYLSYGVSLFDANNVVGIRYDLRKGFGIKATSGERESGIDATYTIDH